MAARNVTHDVCSHCGEIAGASAHGHTGGPDWRWERVEYVPASQLRGAVEAIERSHAILADAIARDSWTKGAAINAESILRHALKRAGGQ